jgi:hypothetical protein
VAGEARAFGGRWRVVERLGRGGQGVVYKVEDQDGVPSEADTILNLKAALHVTQSDIFQMHPDFDKFRPLSNAYEQLPEQMTFRSQPSRNCCRSTRQ